MILTNRENPSELHSPRRSAILAQKSFERVLESTSKACMGKRRRRRGSERVGGEGEREKMERERKRKRERKDRKPLGAHTSVLYSCMYLLI